MSLLVPAAQVGTLGITPSRAGWSYTGMRVLSLVEGGRVMLDLPTEEAAVVPLAGSFQVDLEIGGSWTLVGRTDVFAGPTDLMYLPPGTKGMVVAKSDGELAFCTAASSRSGSPLYRNRNEVSVEIRGAGHATRKIHQLLPADLVGPERLIVVEVFTPDGNWSSYPPHKHDELSQFECPLEEIYYFRFDRGGAFGFHSTYTADRAINQTVMVRHGDVFLVPRGYHGPSAAAPGYPMYYLNAMAGPGPRAWQVTTDPDHTWLWDRWRREDPDPRLGGRETTGKENKR